MDLREIAKNLDYEKLANHIKNLPKDFFQDLDIIKKELVEIEKRLEKIKKFEEIAENIEDSINVITLELTNLKDTIKNVNNLQANEKIELIEKKINELYSSLENFKFLSDKNLKKEEFPSREINDLKDIIKNLENRFKILEEQTNKQNKENSDKFMNLENLIETISKNLETYNLKLKDIENIIKEFKENEIKITNLFVSLEEKINELKKSKIKNVENLHYEITNLKNDLNIIELQFKENLEKIEYLKNLIEMTNKNFEILNKNIEKQISPIIEEKTKEIKNKFEKLINEIEKLKENNNKLEDRLKILENKSIEIEKKLKESKTENQNLNEILNLKEMHDLLTSIKELSKVIDEYKIIE